MKIKIKTYLKLGILLFGVSFILVNCQKEESFNEDTPTPAENESDIQINRLSLTDLKNNKQLSTTFNKFEKHLDVVKRSNTMAKINSSDDSFVILTDEILQTTTSTSETYTFKIETPSYPDATFENFVIEKIADEELFNLYIFSYYTIIFDDNSSLSIILSVRKIHESEINMDDFDGFLETNRMLMIGGCLYNVDENNNPTGEPIWCFGTSGGDGDGASTGNNSNSTGDTVQYISNGNGSCTKYIQTTGPMGFAVTLIEYNVPCPDNTNDSTDNSNNNNNGDNGTGDNNNNNTDNVNDPHFNDDAVSQTGATGSSSSSNTPNTTVVATIPTVPPEMVIRDCLGDIMLSGTSNVDISGWLDNATVVQEKAVANYLNSNSSNPLAENDTNCDDPVALDFVVQAIQVMLNGETTDFQEALDVVISTIIEDEIVDDNLDDCSKGILNELKALQSTDIAEIIKRFGDLNAPYDWEIKTGTPTNPNHAAETNWVLDSNGQGIANDYLTLIKPTYVNQATKIATARTILHEMLHAYILSHIDDVQNENTSDFIEFRELWKMIQKDLTGFNNNPEPVHHEFMANKFIPPLKDALKEWDNSSQSNQYYKDLAWGALTETGTFDHFHPIGSTSRNRIINTNAAEDTNSVQGSISPQGSPCP